MTKRKAGPKKVYVGLFDDGTVWKVATQKKRLIAQGLKRFNFHVETYVRQSPKRRRKP